MSRARSAMHNKKKSFVKFELKGAFGHSDIQFLDIWSWIKILCQLLWHFHFQMCFSPQRHTIFGHQNFQNCSRTVSFFYILTSECAFRHIGMQFSDIWTSKSGPRPWLFLHLKCAFRHSGVQIFWCLLSTKMSACLICLSTVHIVGTRLPQLFKPKASKTSISCAAFATEENRSFHSCMPAIQNVKMTSHLESFNHQNELFVRDFLQISYIQLENPRFLASFSDKAICFFAKPPPLFKEITKACACHDICSSVTFARGISTFATAQNAPPTTTLRKATSQSALPATSKRRAYIHSLRKYCPCHAKHENELVFSDLGVPKRAFRARLLPFFLLWR